jgi:hypothetical protein
MTVSEELIVIVSCHNYLFKKIKNNKYNWKHVTFKIIEITKQNFSAELIVPNIHFMLSI